MGTKYGNARLLCEPLIDALVAREKSFFSTEERKNFVKYFYGQNNEHYKIIKRFIDNNLLTGSTPDWAKGNKTLLTKILMARQFYELDEAQTAQDQAMVEMKFVDQLLARGKNFSSWKERMKFVSNSVGNDKELAKVINGFIKKYIKKEETPEWAGGEFLERLAMARHYFEVDTPPEVIAQCTRFIEALVARGRPFAYKGERITFVKKYLGVGRDTPVSNFIRTNMKNTCCPMWAGEDEVLRQKIATAREYYKLETEQEIDAEAGPNDSRMTEPQQIVCENFVDHLVARGRPFNFKKERDKFVNEFTAYDREIWTTITKFIMNNVMKDVAPRWSSGHDDFNRRLEVARKIFKENIKRGAQRRMPGDEVAENKNGWENGVEGSQGASTSSLKRKYNRRAETDGMLIKRAQAIVFQEVESKPGTMGGRTGEEELEETAEEPVYNSSELEPSDIKHDEEDEEYFREGSQQDSLPGTSYEAEITACSHHDEGQTCCQQINEELKRDVRELQGEVAELKKSNIRIEQQCSLLLQLLSQRGVSVGIQMNPGHVSLPDLSNPLEANVSQSQEGIPQSGHSSLNEGIVPQVSRVKEEGSGSDLRPQFGNLDPVNKHNSLIRANDGLPNQPQSSPAVNNPHNQRNTDPIDWEIRIKEE